MEERSVEGKILRVGDVLIALADLRGRCVMTTFDPDTLAQGRRVLRSILDRFEGRLALNAAVVRAGRVREGSTSSPRLTQSERAQGCQVIASGGASASSAQASCPRLKVTIATIISTGAAR